MTEFASTVDGHLGLLYRNFTDLMRANKTRRFDVSGCGQKDQMFIDMSTMWSDSTRTKMMPVNESKLVLWEESDAPFDYCAEGGEDANNDCRPCMHNNKHGLFFPTPESLLNTIITGECFIDIDNDDTDIQAELDQGMVYFCACDDLLSMKSVPYKVVNKSELKFFVPIGTGAKKMGQQTSIVSSGKGRLSKGMYHRTPVTKSAGSNKSSGSDGATTVDSYGTTSTAGHMASASSAAEDGAARLASTTSLHTPYAASSSASAEATAMQPRVRSRRSRSSSGGSSSGEDTEEDDFHLQQQPHLKTPKSNNLRGREGINNNKSSSSDNNKAVPLSQLSEATSAAWGEDARGSMESGNEDDASGGDDDDMWYGEATQPQLIVEEEEEEDEEGEKQHQQSVVAKTPASALASVPGLRLSSAKPVAAAKIINNSGNSSSSGNSSQTSTNGNGNAPSFASGSARKKFGSRSKQTVALSPSYEQKMAIEASGKDEEDNEEEEKEEDDDDATAAMAMDVEDDEEVEQMPAPVVATRKNDKKKAAAAAAAETTSKSRGGKNSNITTAGGAIGTSKTVVSLGQLAQRRKELTSKIAADKYGNVTLTAHFSYSSQSSNSQGSSQGIGSPVIMSPEAASDEAYGPNGAIIRACRNLFLQGSNDADAARALDNAVGGQTWAGLWSLLEKEYGWRSVWLDQSNSIKVPPWTVSRLAEECLEVNKSKFVVPMKKQQQDSTTSKKQKQASERISKAYSNKGRNAHWWIDELGLAQARNDFFSTDGDAGGAEGKEALYAMVYEYRLEQPPANTVWDRALRRELLNKAVADAKDEATFLAEVAKKEQDILKQEMARKEKERRAKEKARKQAEDARKLAEEKEKEKVAKRLEREAERKRKEAEFAATAGDRALKDLRRVESKSKQAKAAAMATTPEPSQLSQLGSQLDSAASSVYSPIPRSVPEVDYLLGLIPEAVFAQCVQVVASADTDAVSGGRAAARGGGRASRGSGDAATAAVPDANTTRYWSAIWEYLRRHCDWENVYKEDGVAVGIPHWSPYNSRFECTSEEDRIAALQSICGLSAAMATSVATKRAVWNKAPVNVKAWGMVAGRDYIIAEKDYVLAYLHKWGLRAPVAGNERVYHPSAIHTATAAGGRALKLSQEDNDSSDDSGSDNESNKNSTRTVGKKSKKRPISATRVATASNNKRSKKATAPNATAAAAAAGGGVAHMPPRQKSKVPVSVVKRDRSSFLLSAGTPEDRQRSTSSSCHDVVANDGPGNKSSAAAVIALAGMGGKSRDSGDARDHDGDVIMSATPDGRVYDQYEEEETQLPLDNDAMDAGEDDADEDEEGDEEEEEDEEEDDDEEAAMPWVLKHKAQKLAAAAASAAAAAAATVPDANTATSTTTGGVASSSSPFEGLTVEDAIARAKVATGIGRVRISDSAAVAAAVTASDDSAALSPRAPVEGAAVAVTPALATPATSSSSSLSADEAGIGSFSLLLPPPPPVSVPAAPASASASTDTTPVAGREGESAEIQSYITASLDARDGHNLYVCGSPGTGKTLSVDVVLAGLADEQSNSNNQSSSHASSTSSSSPHNSLLCRRRCADGSQQRFVVVKVLGPGLTESSLFLQMAEALAAAGALSNKEKSGLKSMRSPASGGTGSSSSRSGGSSGAVAEVKQTVLNYLSRQSEYTAGKASAAKSCAQAMVVLVLDEVDKAPVRLVEALLHVGSESAASRLIFVGIANSLNYPNEVRVTSVRAQPTVVLFKPYTSAGLLSILLQRCYGLIHDSAMQLLSRKVASMNGDVRSLLNIAHSAIKAAAVDIAKGTHALCKAPAATASADPSAYVLAQTVSPATAVVKNVDLVKLMQKMGVGASREHESVESMPPMSRLLLVALVTADLPQPMSMPGMYNAFNTYAELVNCNTMTKEEVRGWASTLVSYMLLSQSDASTFGRKRVDPDKVTYKLQCSAVNLLRVKNLESMHKPHVQRFVDRMRANDEDAGALL